MKLTTKDVRLPTRIDTIMYTGVHIGDDDVVLRLDVAGPRDFEIAMTAREAQDLGNELYAMADAIERNITTTTNTLKSHLS